MPVIPVSVKFSTVNKKTIVGAIKRLETLRKKVGTMNATTRKLVAQVNKLEKSVKKSNATLKKHGKELGKVSGRLDTARKRTTKANKAVARLNKTTRTGTKDQKGFGRGLAITGLFFGALGAQAGMAARQITDVFSKAVSESSTLLSEFTRASVFSDKVSLVPGKIDLSAAQDIKNEIFRVADETGIATLEVAKIWREVEKAVPSNVDVNPFARIVVDFALLEPDLSGEQLAADVATISSNFADLPIDTIGDAILALSKATKLNQSASSKAIGFMAQNAKSYTNDLDEVAIALAVVANQIPGFQGNAGRAGRQLLSTFENPQTIAALKNMGLAITDVNGKSIGLLPTLDKVAGAYQHFNSISLEHGAAFLDQFGLSQNAVTFLKAYGDASEESKKAIAEQFANKGGQLKIAAGVVSAAPEATIQKLKNKITEVSTAFTSGLSPALTAINELFNEIFADGEINGLIKDLGKAIGKDLVGIVKDLIREWKRFKPLFKKFRSLIPLVSKAVIGLVAALHGLAVIAPIIGLAFGLNFVATMLAATGATGGLAVAMKGLLAKFLIILVVIAAVGIMVWALARIFGLLDKQFEISEGISGKWHDNVAKNIGDTLINIGALAAGGATLGFLIAGPMGAVVGGLLGAIAGSVLSIITDIQKIIDKAGELDYLDFQYGKEDSQEKHDAYWKNVFDNSLGAAYNAWMQHQANLVAFLAKNEWAVGIATAINTQIENIAGNFDPERWQIVADAVVQGFKDKFQGAINFVEFIKKLINYEGLVELGKSIGQAIADGIIDIIENHPLIRLAKIVGLIPKEFSFKSIKIPEGEDGTNFANITPFSQYGGVQEAPERVEEAPLTLEERYPHLDFSLFDKLVKDNIMKDTPNNRERWAQQVDEPFIGPHKEINDVNNPSKVTETVDSAMAHIADSVKVLADVSKEIPDEISLNSHLDNINIPVSPFGGSTPTEYVNPSETPMSSSVGFTDLYADTINKNIESGENLNEDTLGISEAIQTQTEEVDVNSDRLVESSNAFETEIIAVGENKDKITKFSVLVDRAANAFILLAREGAEAARRLASLKVSDEGKFSISALQTPGVSSDIVNNLGSGLAKLEEEITPIEEELEETIEKSFNRFDESKAILDAKIKAEQERATKIFDGSTLINPDKPTISTDDLISSQTSGSTKSVEGLNNLINGLLDQGKSEAFVQPLVNQLNELISRTSLASGGIVKNPLNAIVGDVPGGEAIIPLRDLPDIIARSLPQTVEGDKKIDITYSPTIVIENSGNLSVEDIKDRVVDELGRDLKSKIEEVI